MTLAPTREPSSGFADSAFMRIWIVSLLAKFALAAWVPFVSDEAYYWVWSHFPDWSYFDHPPMVAWLFWLGRHVDVGGQSSRWPAVVLGHSTFLVWRAILKDYLSARDQALWLLLVVFSPFLGAGSLIVTPDIPLVFFWSLSLLCFLRALEKPTLAWHVALGCSLGLGFCSKYHIVLFLPAAAGWLAVSGKWKTAGWRYVPATIAAGLVASLPVFWWNYQNAWQSFRFQLSHGLDGGDFQSSWPIEYVLSQLALIFPPLLYLALRGREPKEARWLRWFAWTPLAFFLASSLKARVEANWPIAAFPAVYALAYFNRGTERWIRFTLGAWIVATIFVASEIALDWLPIDSTKLKTNEVSQYDALIPEIQKYPDLFASSYQMASALSYRSRQMIPKLAGMNRLDFYDFRDQSRPKSDRFMLAAEEGQSLPKSLIKDGFEIASSRKVTDKLLILEVVRRAQDRDL